MKKLTILDWIAFVFVFIGGLNWGLVAWFNTDLVQMLFSTIPYLAQGVYTLVAVSAIYLLYYVFGE